MNKYFHNFLMGISVLPALLVMPAMAADPNTSGVAFLFGDVSIAGQSTIDNTAFGGRRIEWTNGKYRNEFPNYQLVGRSFELSDSVAYVGPVNLTLRELTGKDNLTYNYQQNGVDVDLAALASVGFGNTVDEIIAGVASVIGASDAQYTAPGVIAFAQRDDTKTAGSMNFEGVTAAIDGATVSAKSINVTNGSTLNFVKQDPSSLSGAQRWYTNAEDIDSDGQTTLNANNINIDGSILDVKSGATLVINNKKTNGATIIQNVSSAYGALTANGNGSILLGGNSLVFDNNASSSHGAALYFKDQTAGNNTARLIANNITFSNNVSDYSASSGGAVFSTGGNMFILGTTNTFRENSISGTDVEAKLHKRGGGAVANQSYEVEGVHTPIDATMVIGKENGKSTNLFINNTSSMNGGAVMNRAVDTDGNAFLTINGTTRFYENSAVLNGGAIYNFADTGKTAQITMNNGTYTFTSNTAGGRGGAIYNSGDLTIDGANFETNSAYVGGAISASTDGTTNIKNTEFRNNSATMVGAIDNKGILIVDNSKFIGNHATWWGAIMSGSDAVSATITNTLFQNNYAEEIGAVSLCSPEDNVLTNVQFIGNKATSTASDSDGAGALFLGAVSRTVLTNVTFDSNESNTHGGAISTRSADLADNSAAKVDIINSTFTGNKALTTGGALDNYLYSSVADVTAVYVENTGFVANSADKGGAIYNHGELDRADGIASLSMKNVVFEGNTATTNGGAIYNASSFTLSGTNTFTGNTANGVANDIYNVGALNIASGTTTIDGGIDGTGTLTIAEGATLNIGTASVVQDNITLNGTLLATLRNGVAAQLISGTADDSFTGDGTLKLAIRGEDTYHVFGNGVFDVDNVEIESSVYDYQWANGNKDLIATMKSVEDIAEENSLTNETAATVANLANSSSGQLNDLAVAIQEKLATKTDEARAEVERVKAAIHPETESVVQSVSSSVQSTVTSLASGRMAMPTIGRNGGDVKMTSGGVWAQGIYNKAKQNDAFSGYTRGIAGGLDSTFNKVAMVGAGYAFAHSDVTGTERDTEIDSLTVFLYGQYKPNAWYMNAVANYTMSDYTETGSALGVGVSANYGVDSFGANLATGYDFAGGVTPELALRYMHIDSADYTNSLGIKNELDGANYLTASIGTKYTFDMNVARHLSLRPELRYGVKYDLLSDKQVATVTMPGVNAYALTGERLSRIGGEFGIGLTMNYRGLDMSLNYDIEAREDYTSQSGRVKFRYNF